MKKLRKFSRNGPQSGAQRCYSFRLGEPPGILGGPLGSPGFAQGVHWGALTSIIDAKIIKNQIICSENLSILQQNPVAFRVGPADRRMKSLLRLDKTDRHRPNPVGYQMCQRPAIAPCAGACRQNRRSSETRDLRTVKTPFSGVACPPFPGKHQSDHSRNRPEEKAPLCLTRSVYNPSNFSQLPSKKDL